VSAVVRLIAAEANEAPALQFQMQLSLRIVLCAAREIVYWAIDLNGNAVFSDREI
jgi:hypothetical protein